MAPGGVGVVDGHRQHLAFAVGQRHGEAESALSERVKCSLVFGPDGMSRARRQLDELGWSRAQAGSVEDRVHAAVPDQHEFESSVPVQAGPHAGRPGEMKCKDVVIALLKASESGLSPHHDLETTRARTAESMACNITMWARMAEFRNVGGSGWTRFRTRRSPARVKAI